MAVPRCRVHRHAMGRRKRPYHPGTIFHLTSRTHRREAWFDPGLRTTIVELIHRMVARTDAQLLAYAVMPNHLHIVLRQGRMELAQVMQPLMRRVALQVQRQHGFEGSVVERPYRDRSCTTPDHTRSAIIYTHLNPWRAGLCGDDLAYDWTSHAAYLPGGDPEKFGILPEVRERVLELFADQPNLTPDELAERYRAALEWRMRADRFQMAAESGSPSEPPPATPAMVQGDLAWKRLRPLSIDRVESERQPSLDLRDFIKSLLVTHAPGADLTDFRGPNRSHRIARIRLELIRAAARNGFRTGEIARFFAISPQLVSMAKYNDVG